MTKAEIISEAFDKIGLPKQDAEELVEMILDTIKQTLKQGETVKLSGFRQLRGTEEERKKGPQPEDGPGDRDHPEERGQLQAEHDIQGTCHRIRTSPVSSSTGSAR